MGVVVVSTVGPQRERVTGASRRVVYRLDLPAMPMPSLLPLTVSAACREAEGNERSTASCQVSLSIDQHSKTSLDVELGTISDRPRCRSEHRISGLENPQYPAKW